MRRCVGCNVLHQHIQMSPAGLAAWYTHEYHVSVYSHSYAHDRSVARKRVAAYGGFLQGPVLDVGCGNGAFVDACKVIGIVAIGQDIGGRAAIYCPIDRVQGKYATITMHDVLEHVLHPLEFLGDVRRILSPGGALIVDFPDFFSVHGVHHWKPIEHIWMLDRAQLYQVLSSAGFSIERCDEPVPGKLTVYCR